MNQQRTIPNADELKRLRAETRLVWCDLEMTGLVPERDRILEAAFIITDGDFRTVAESDEWAVRQPPDILNAMDEWNTRTHAASGLTERCLNSPLSLREVEKKSLAFIREHVGRRKSPLCGNSICQDRRFLAAHMPELEEYLHYRNYDVSVFKIYAQLYRPDIAHAVEEMKDPDLHRALNDIRDSIREMHYYAEHLLPPVSGK